MPVCFEANLPKGFNYPEPMPVINEGNDPVPKPEVRGRAAWEKKKAQAERAARAAKVLKREGGFPKLKGRVSRTPSPASSLGSIEE